MTEKRFTHKKWYNEGQLFDGEDPFAIVDVYNQADKICDKLNELHEENQELLQLKYLLQDVGIIPKENDILKIRKEIASKFLKPLFINNGYDVDINVEDGFTISPKENKE